MFFKIFIKWLPFAVVTTFLCGLIYLAVQQDIRISANDPQIQIAQDIAQALSHNVPPEQIVGQNQTDISKSLDTYVIILDTKGKVLASSASINGTTPTLPAQLFTDLNKQSQEKRFTWQTKEGVRSAVVVVPFQGNIKGYLLVGRNIKEIEIRERNLELQVGSAWLVTLLATFGAVALQEMLSKKKYFK